MLVEPKKISGQNDFLVFSYKKVIFVSRVFYLAHARFESQNKNDPVLSYSLIYELFYSLSVRLLTYLQQAFLAIVKLKRSLRSGLL